MFCPDILVLEGGLTNAGDIILEPLNESIRKHTPKDTLEKTKIEVSQLGGFSAVFGVAKLASHEVLDIPLLNTI